MATKAMSEMTDDELTEERDTWVAFSNSWLCDDKAYAQKIANQYDSELTRIARPSRGQNMLDEKTIEQAQKFVAVAAYNLGQARVTVGAAQLAFIQTAFDAISRAKAIMGVE